MTKQSELETNDKLLPGEPQAPAIPLLPCPFCGSKIRHIESLARSFDPPRLYHEWHHVEDNEEACPVRKYIGKIVAAANDDAEFQEKAICRWNTRTPVSDLAITQAEIMAIGDTVTTLRKMGHTHVSEETAVADQIIGQIEDRFPNWRSYRDLIDCIDCTLHDLRKEVDRG